MTYGELWLLDHAVRWHATLSLLAGPDRWVREQWNKHGHGLDKIALATTLLRLRDADQIRFWDSRGMMDGITPDEIGQALDDQPFLKGELGITYSLTASGGVLWEKVCSPDWSRYFECTSLEGDDETYELFASSQATALRAAKYQSIMIARSAVQNSFQIIGGLQRVSPWHATYWKTMDEGYRIRFRRVENDCQQVDAEFSKTFREEITYFDSWNRFPLFQGTIGHGSEVEKYPQRDTAPGADPGKNEAE